MIAPGCQERDPLHVRYRHPASARSSRRDRAAIAARPGSVRDQDNTPRRRYDEAKRGIAAFIAEIVKPAHEGERIQSAAVDRMIAAIDTTVSAQVNAIMHSEAFQQLESAWRSVKFLVDRTDFRQNIKIEMLNASKQDSLSDFEDSPEVVKSGLYKHVYVDEYGQFGGQPFAAVITNYQFTPGAQDVKLMRYHGGRGYGPCSRDRLGCAGILRDRPVRSAA